MDQFNSSVNHSFDVINSVLAKFFFFDVFFFMESFKFPFVVFCLFISGIYFTFKMNFVNVRLFKHAIVLVLGFLDKDQKKEGEISHFKALTTALSATVGLGNIAGVAIAISVGGPGATFWMIVMGFLGMSTKFTECTLGVMYRERRKDGHFMGGPIKYLSRGLSEKGYPRLGKCLAVLFAICCIGGSFGGGVAFQVNQSLNAISLSLPALADHSWIYGCVLIVLVALVIIGGIKRIAQVSGKIVPLMCLIYVGMAVIVLVSYYELIPTAILSIFQGAFTPKAGLGGFLGVLIVGLQRAAFSNEAGLGSSAIAHSAAKVNDPVEEGAVALLEPFIDTIFICTITALVIVVTGVYENPEYAHLVAQQKGAALTSQGLSQVHYFFPYILSASVFLFAFSTIISWSYYGERCFSYLFGEKLSIAYKVLVLFAIFLGSIAKTTSVMDFCDLMILSMSLPNLVGVVMLSGKVKTSLNSYILGLKSFKS